MMVELMWPGVCLYEVGITEAHCLEAPDGGRGVKSHRYEVQARGCSGTLDFDVKTPILMIEIYSSSLPSYEVQ